MRTPSNCEAICSRATARPCSNTRRGSFGRFRSFSIDSPVADKSVWLNRKRATSCHHRVIRTVVEIVSLMPIEARRRLAAIPLALTRRQKARLKTKILRRSLQKAACLAQEKSSNSRAMGVFRNYDHNGNRPLYLCQKQNLAATIQLLCMLDIFGSEPF